MTTGRVWTCKDALDWTTGYLERKGDDHPRRSAEWLLGAATGLSRVEIYAHHDRPLTPDELTTLRAAIERRSAGEPLQYVTGEMPFRHLVIHVERGVFIPRPETEVLVDVALAAIGGVEKPLVGEVCTGSGCVAVSIAYERPEARVWTSDVSEQAVAAARRNALYAGVADRVQVTHGDLFAPYAHELPGSLDLVVANPPYIPSADIPGLPAEVIGFEPHLALDGGPDGLDVARRIAAEAASLLGSGGVLALELDETRAAAFASEIEGTYTGIKVHTDLNGRDRIVVGTIREARLP